MILNPAKVAVIMYHYVRPIHESKYPRIKGLEIHKFINQLEFLQQNFTIINPLDFLEHVLGRNELKVPNPCLLTFDDGLKDHVQYVMPELQKRGLSACFFVPSASSKNLELLDVHAIHFILESGHSGKDLLGLAVDVCRKFEFDAKVSHLKSALNELNRFDDLSVASLKRLLQYELPSAIRHKVVCDLFAQVRGDIANELVEELYLNTADLQYMAQEGMFIGPHGHTHSWLGYQSLSDQRYEVSESVNFLRKIGVLQENWMFAYPYGSYNSETISLLESLGCKAAFTTNVGFSSLSTERALAFSRFDTNDYPQ
jgi:peptidoglycan/xylan/chitin deacetylase (PgdA/CDA1 family)